MDNVGAVARPKLVEAIRRARKTLKLTQVDIAGQIGVTQGTISRIEKNDRARITVEVAARMEKWLQKNSNRIMQMGVNRARLTRQPA